MVTVFGATRHEENSMTLRCLRPLLSLLLVLSAVVQAEPHAAVGASVEVNVPLNPRYAGKSGVASLVDGELATKGYGGGLALGFEGLDVEITIQLDEPIQVRAIAAEFVQVTEPAVYLPVSVDFAVSENGTNFRTVATVKPKATEQDKGPLHERIQVTDLDVKAKAVRIRVANGGTVPPDHRAPQALRWTFISEVLVNPGDKPKSVWDAVRSYEFGASRTCLARVENMLRTTEGEEREAILGTLREIFADAAATTDAKRFACAMFGLHGGAADVPALAVVLANEDLLGPAASALASLGTPEAEKALLAALPESNTKGALVNALAQFQSPATVQVLAALLPDPKLGQLAARALSTIGGPAAVKALAGQLPGAKAASRRQWLSEALLAGADDAELTAAVRTAALRSVMAQGTPAARLAGAGALLRHQADPAALAEVLKAAQSPKASQRTQAATLLGELVQRRGIEALGAGFEALPVGARCALIRREEDQTWLIAHVAAPDIQVRQTVVQRLGECGNGQAVPVLCARLAGADKAEGKALVEALAGLRGEKVAASLMATANKAKPVARPFLTDVFRRREQTAAGALVLSWTRDGSVPGRDGWRALADIAGPELLAPLTAELAGKPEDRKRIGKALLAATKRVDDPKAGQPLAKRFAAARDAAEREILVQALGAMGDRQTLRKALSDADLEVRLAAARGLGQCGELADVTSLFTLADTPDARQNVLALRSALQLLTVKADPAAGADISASLATAWKTARRDEERQQVIATATRYRQAGLLPLLGDNGIPAGLRPEADAAYVNVAETAWPDAPEQVADTLKRIAAATKDKKLQARARTVLDRLAAFQPFLAKLARNPWQPAFNGRDLTGWRPVGGKKDSWTVVDGLLVANAKGGGWLARTDEMSDYLFELEFRLPPGGNSGLFLRPPLEGNPAWEGIEIQLLDDAAPQYAGKLSPEQYCASIYGMGAAQPGISRPAGQWQKLRVLCAGRHVAAWLNGQPVSYAALDDHMAKADKVRGLKRAAGFPGLQNEHGPIHFRNLRFRDLR
jgi:hypothetical protein